jgi:hypothetical protein
MQAHSTDENGGMKNRMDYRQLLANGPIILVVTLLGFLGSGGSTAVYNGRTEPIKTEQQSTPVQNGQEFKQDQSGDPHADCCNRYVNCHIINRYFDRRTCRWVVQECCYDRFCHHWVTKTKYDSCNTYRRNLDP